MRADAGAIVALINAAYRPPGDAPGWTSETGLLEGPRIDDATILREFSAGRFLLARDSVQRMVMACVHIAPARDGAWYLSLLAVTPARQADGLGRNLLREVERRAVSAGVPGLRITVIRQRETLIAWYERRGFYRTGATLPFPSADPSVGTPLREDLELIVLEKPLEPR